MVIVVVFDGHLRLAIRTKMRHLAALAHFGETIRQTVRQMNRQRHKHVGLVARIAEHHALVARALRLIPLFTGRLRLLLATQPGNAWLISGLCSVSDTVTPQESASSPTRELV